MNRHRAIRCVPLLLAALISRVAPAAELPEPPRAADFRLIAWREVVDYCRTLDDASDRVLVRELGRTTEDRPYLVAVVAAPETIRDLDHFRGLQRRLALPDIDDRGRPAVEPSKVVVLITASIHSAETASTFMALQLMHELASRDDPATREILDRVIVLVVPSANPDGVDIVADWYDRSRGHPWEGGGLPRLYHKYAGHDTNRDWFMLNLAETRLLTRLLYQEWFPTITYDVHQMGPRGARIFVPPFHDPINPNLDPRIHQSIAMIGAHMAAALASEGRRGVLTGALYDNWWNGGNRTTPQRHNMIGILTEAASVRLASPVFLERDQLRGGARGFPDHRPATNFNDPWPGGWWRLGDIAAYELTCARALLTLAARYKDFFQANYQALGRDAIARGRAEPPFAWVVPADRDDPGTAALMVRTLQETGIVVQRARAPFQAGGARYPAGSWILPASQPYRAHLKDMMERQVYPPRFNDRGEAEPPYDVAGWTLPLMMGVKALDIAAPFEAEAVTVDRVESPAGSIDRSEDEAPDSYLILGKANDDYAVLNDLLAAGLEVADGADAWLVAGGPRARAVLDRGLKAASTRLVARPGTLPPADSKALHAPRIGLYQPWIPSMDEGWTRLVLERFRFPFTTLHNDEVRAGDLHKRFDVILIPSITPAVLRDGYPPRATEPAYVGGLGREGADALRAFALDGGTIVCLEDSCDYTIDEFQLPVVNALKGLRSSEFYGPGSIVRIHAERGPLTRGMPAEGSAYFDRSWAFEIKDKGPAVVAVRYGPSPVLESGWLQGEDRLAGKAAVVEVPLGRGRVILFGFPPQHRGQTHGTFRLLFNALLRGGVEPSG